MPVIVGAPRSGTTLLRYMIDSHPNLAIPPETGFLAFAPQLSHPGGVTRDSLFQIVTRCPPEAPAWDDYGIEAEDFRRELEAIDPFNLSEGFRAFYRLYARKQKKPRYGEKNPGYCEHIALIERLLPEAHFVHIIRDGRDAALSLRPLWFAPGRDMRTLAQHWRRLVGCGREAGFRARAYMEVRYEDLVRTPQTVLQTVCEFVALDYDPIMLRYWERTPERLKEHRTRRRPDGSVLVTHEERVAQQRLTMKPPQPERIFRWKKEMTASEHAEFIAIAGGTLEELGYEVDFQAKPVEVTGHRSGRNRAVPSGSGFANEFHDEPLVVSFAKPFARWRRGYARHD